MSKKKAAHVRARPITGYGIHVASQLMRMSGGRCRNSRSCKGRVAYWLRP
jgi:hypothetical protein